MKGTVVEKMNSEFLELIEFLEYHFDIEVSEEETLPENLGSISSLTSFVMSKRSVWEPTR